MAKFSSARARPNVSHVVSTTGARISTHEGGLGYERDAKSELFLLAVSNFVSEGTFYESAFDRDDRFGRLVAKVTAEDPDWVRRMIPWLRNEAQMRSASLVAAAEYVKAGGELGRQVVSAALQRADEPAEMLAYWHQRHGRRVPKPVKRGVADAVVRLYNERAALKYDGHAKAWRMADVIELVHPEPKDAKQSALFKYLLDKRHDRASDVARTSGLLQRLRGRSSESLPVRTCPRRKSRRPVSPGSASLVLRRWTLLHGSVRSHPWATWRCCVTCVTSTRPALATRLCSS